MKIWLKSLLFLSYFKHTFFRLEYSISRRKKYISNRYNKETKQYIPVYKEIFKVDTKASVLIYWLDIFKKERINLTPERFFLLKGYISVCGFFFLGGGGKWTIRVKYKIDLLIANYSISKYPTCGHDFNPINQSQNLRSAHVRSLRSDHPWADLRFNFN